MLLLERAEKRIFVRLILVVFIQLITAVSILYAVPYSNEDGIGLRPVLGRVERQRFYDLAGEIVDEGVYSNSRRNLQAVYTHLHRVYTDSIILQAQCSRALEYLKVLGIIEKQGEIDADFILKLSVEKELNLMDFLKFLTIHRVIDNGLRANVVSKFNLLKKTKPLVYLRLSRYPKADFIVDIAGNILSLREMWMSNPETFLDISEYEYQKGIDKIIEFMDQDVKEGNELACFIGFGDQAKIGAMNPVWTRGIVDRLIPIMVQASNIIVKRYTKDRGFSVRITGDEQVIVLPYDAKNVNRFRLELQAALADFLSEMYALVKLSGVTDDNVEYINQALQTDGLTGVYKDKDGFFLLFKRPELSAGNLSKEADSAVSDLSEKVSVQLGIDGETLKILSPRVSFGITRASKNFEDVHANFGKSIRYAEYIRNIAGENGYWGTMGSFLRGKLDGFQEESEEITIPRLSDEERRKIAEKYSDYGVKIYLDQIHEFYPAVKRDALYYVIQQMSSAYPGVRVLVRGPPDNFYIAHKKQDGSVDIIKIESVYKPEGEGFKNRVDIAKDHAQKYFGSEDAAQVVVRQRWDGLEWCGFKIMNEYLAGGADHGLGNEIILAETKNIVSVLEDPLEDIMGFASRITNRINNAVAKITDKSNKSEAQVKLIIGIVNIREDELDNEAVLRKAIGIVDDMTEMAEYEDAVSIVQEYKDKKEDFDKRRSEYRGIKRRKNTPVLYRSYRDPFLTEKDLVLVRDLKPVGLNFYTNTAFVPDSFLWDNKKLWERKLIGFSWENERAVISSSQAYKLGISIGQGRLNRLNNALYILGDKKKELFNIKDLYRVTNNGLWVFKGRNIAWTREDLIPGINIKLLYSGKARLSVYTRAFFLAHEFEHALGNGEETAYKTMVRFLVRNGIKAAFKVSEDLYSKGIGVLSRDNINLTLDLVDSVIGNMAETQDEAAIIENVKEKIEELARISREHSAPQGDIKSRDIGASI